MAAPPPPPPPQQSLAGEVFRIIASSGELSRSLNQHLNYRDLLTFRHLTPNTLANTLAVPMLNHPQGAPVTGRGLVPVNTNPAGQTVNPPPPQVVPPTTIPAPLQTQLQGVSCQDQPVNGICPNRHACAWGPNTVPMRHCVEQNPQNHPRGNFRVCDHCCVANYIDTSGRIDLPSIKAILCRKCSLREKRRNPTAMVGAAINHCACAHTALSPHRCKSCMHESEREVLETGNAWLRWLEREHIVRDRKTKRKKLVMNNKIRKYPACPTRGCGEPAWTVKSRAINPLGLKPFAMTHAAIACLCCGGVTCQG